MFTGRLDLRNLAAAFGSATSDRTVRSVEPEPTPRAKPRRTGFIVVRLTNENSREADDAETLEDAARLLSLESVLQVLEHFGIGPGQRRVTVVPPARLRELEAQARLSELPPLHSLTAYWLLDVRRRFEIEDEILLRLLLTPGIDTAYPILEGGGPDAGQDALSGSQRYLESAPEGIDARFAHTLPNGCGNGIKIVDVEQGWTLNHQEFPLGLSMNSPLHGDSIVEHDHGTAVLGILVARDHPGPNGLGIVGTANAAEVSVSSYRRMVNPMLTYYSDAIIAAREELSVGDVMVIEAYSAGLPVERYDDTFDAIRLSVALGVTVVAAAGNNATHLADDQIVSVPDPDLPDDQQQELSGIWDPGHVNFRDSGAILCGASVYNAGNATHSNWPMSNYGERIDCFAWGQGVVTTGYGNHPLSAAHTNSFSGTSAATAIVAGAAAVVQGMHKSVAGTPLSPLQLRYILSTNGTLSQTHADFPIGMMPDLRAILDSVLGMTPDVYLRDYVGDNGAVPTSGLVSRSPDIFVLLNAVGNPQGMYGAGSGQEDMTLGSEVLAMQDHHVYVRARNRGGMAAVDVTADVYWSVPSTLAVPSMWKNNLIGTANFANVPTGNSLIVSDGIAWSGNDVPPPGHYCFFAILDQLQDSAPPLPDDLEGISNYKAFIRNNNNVAWRNFNVRPLGEAAQEPDAQRFLIANFPTAWAFDFVIKLKLPREVRVVLELPNQFARPFCSGLDLDCERVDECRARITLPTAVQLTARDVLLPPDARIACRFLIEGMSEHGQPGNSLSIGQFHEGDEVGRVSWVWSNRKENG